MARRHTVCNGSVGCDFVSGEVFNNRVTTSKDPWDPARGLHADLPSESHRDAAKVITSTAYTAGSELRDFDFASLSRKKRKLARETQPMLPPLSPARSYDGIPSSAFALLDTHVPSSSKSNNIPQGRKKSHC